MKKQSKWLVALLILALAMFSFAACGGGDEPAEEPPAEEPATEEPAAEEEVTMDDMPEELATEVETIKGYAQTLGEQLSGEWGDQYAELLASGEAREAANYQELLQPLADYQEEIGAYYIYMVAEDPESTTDPADWMITMDASDPADDWGEPLEFEIQFQEANDGEAATARSAWYDDPDAGTDPVWSAFAPVMDSEGNVVGVVGIDYPIPVADDYPDWIRDNEAWNGLEE